MSILHKSDYQESQKDANGAHLYVPSQYTHLANIYNKNEFSSIAKLLKNVAYHTVHNTKYPILKLLKAVCRRLLINEFQSIFFAYVVQTNDWNINDEIIGKYWHSVRDIVCYSTEDPKYKAIILYLLLCGFTVKYYLNEDAEMFSNEMDKICPDFRSIFQQWAKQYAQTTLKINPKNLNKVYKSIYMKMQSQQVQADYNSLVDSLLQISPSYNPDKDKDKEAKNAQPPQQSQTRHEPLLVPRQNPKTIPPLPIPFPKQTEPQNRSINLLDPTFMTLNNSIYQHYAKDPMVTSNLNNRHNSNALLNNMLENSSFLIKISNSFTNNHNNSINNFNLSSIANIFGGFANSSVVMRKKNPFDLGSSMLGLDGSGNNIQDDIKEFNLGLNEGKSDGEEQQPPAEQQNNNNQQGTNEPQLRKLLKPSENEDGRNSVATGSNSFTHWNRVPMPVPASGNMMGSMLGELGEQLHLARGFSNTSQYFCSEHNTNNNNNNTSNSSANNNHGY